MKLFFEIDDNKFGINMKEGVLKFYAPEILLKNIDKMNRFEELNLFKSYLQILKEYYYSKSDISLYYRESMKSISFDAIESYLNILNDYMENNFLYSFSNENRNGNRNINWNKTIKNNDIIIQGESLFYGSFKSSNKINNKNDNFIKIYFSILNEAAKFFLNGPLIDIENKININEAIFHVNKYLDNNFKDRNIFIAKQIKNILVFQNKSTINEQIFETKYHENFEHIFQFLVEKNVRDFSCFKEKRNGHYVSEDQKKIGMILKLDHLIKIQDYYLILDSKYYKNVLKDKKFNNLPKTDDIIKQVGYKLYISEIKKIPINKIKNIFIFPSDLRNEYFFCEHIVNDDPNNFFHISCLFVDIETLVINFLKKKTNKRLIHLLESKLN